MVAMVIDIPVTSDKEEVELKEVFINVTAEEGPDDEYYCHGDNGRQVCQVRCLYQR